MIKSSFVKSDKNKAKDDLNKAFFGHAEFDAIFSNSIKKGTTILIEEDYPTSMHVSFNRYFVGSGFHLEQNCFVYDVFPKRWYDMIPVKSTSEEKREQEKLAISKQKEENKIAWRYNHMTIKLKEEALSKDIPRLDLSRNVADKEKVKNLLLSKDINQFGNLKELLDDVCNSLQNSFASENDTKLKKICITNLFGNFSKIKYTDQELIKFLYAIKTITRASHMLLVLTIPPTVSEKLKSLFYMNFDLVIKLEPLFENTEFLDFNGMLHILKYPQINNYLNFKLDTLTWGLKASSKKRIEIEKLYLQPPDQDNINADNVYKEENKTQTIICSNKPSGKTDLDF
ncbi:hypothetical protein ABPG74_012154 [Tetrahymena malaccensis]